MPVEAPTDVRSSSGKGSARDAARHYGQRPNKSFERPGAGGQARRTRLGLLCALGAHQVMRPAAQLNR